MNKRTVVATLLEIAQGLEANGNKADAKLLDLVADRVAQNHFDETNPDFMAEMNGYGGEDNYNGQQDLMDANHADMSGESDMGEMGGEGMGGEHRLMELASKPHLSPEEEHEYNALLDQLYGGSQGDDQDDLEGHLSAGGANVSGGGEPFGGMGQ